MLPVEAAPEYPVLTRLVKADNSRCFLLLQLNLYRICGMYSVFNIPSFSEKYLSFGKAIVRTGVVDSTFQQHNWEFLLKKRWKNVFSSTLVFSALSLDKYLWISPVAINNFFDIGVKNCLLLQHGRRIVLSCLPRKCLQPFGPENGHLNRST